MTYDFGDMDSDSFVGILSVWWRIMTYDFGDMDSDSFVGILSVWWRIMTYDFGNMDSYSFAILTVWWIFRWIRWEPWYRTYRICLTVYTWCWILWTSLTDQRTRRLVGGDKMEILFGFTSAIWFCLDD
jgi:hypothetical protein